MNDGDTLGTLGAPPSKAGFSCPFTKHYVQETGDIMINCDSFPDLNRIRNLLIL